MTMSPHRKTEAGVFGSLVASLAASACCLLPLALVALGVGGALVGTLQALEPFQPVFIALSIGALAYAGYREYRTTMAPDCACEVGVRAWIRRGLLVFATIAVTGVIVSPWLIEQASGSAESPGSRASESAAVDEAALQEVVLEVDDMTCASCTYTVRRALEQVDGVSKADVTFEPPQAVVTYDASRANVPELTRATTQAGYPSRVKNHP